MSTLTKKWKKTWLYNLIWGRGSGIWWIDVPVGLAVLMFYLWVAIIMGSLLSLFLSSTLLY